MVPNPRAADSLRGLALGDSFGGTWFFREPGAVTARMLAPGPWRWTDDTAMAISLLAVLSEAGTVEPDRLARAFADAYAEDPHRNYGAGMHDVLAALAAGRDWREVTAAQFGGRGSWGNGAAMRVAPLGVWFADDLDRVVAEATTQARVTHAHPEAAAGAVAVAVAAALAVGGVRGADLLRAAAERVPATEVGTRLGRVAAFPAGTAPGEVAGEVGCGFRISAPDTVPYALWCAAHRLDDIAEALWITAEPGGDIDTTCAIVGGIAGGVGLDGVPDEWWAAVEPLPVTG